MEDLLILFPKDIKREMQKEEKKNIKLLISIEKKKVKIKFNKSKKIYENDITICNLNNNIDINTTNRKDKKIWHKKGSVKKIIIFGKVDENKIDGLFENSKWLTRNFKGLAFLKPITKDESQLLVENISKIQKIENNINKI